MSNDKAIYKIDIDYGRMGSVQGAFAGFKEDAKLLQGKTIHLDEYLGKHSEVWFEFNDENVKLITDEDHVVDLFIEHDFSSGLNPFEHISEAHYGDGKDYHEVLLYHTQGISN